MVVTASVPVISKLQEEVEGISIIQTYGIENFMKSELQCEIDNWIKLNTNKEYIGCWFKIRF